MKQVILNLILFILIVCSISCGSSEKDSVAVAEEPTEKLIRHLKFMDYSIVLNDMTIKEKNKKREFQHKYHILKVINDSLVVDSLDWKTVSKTFFEKHENDLGMEIVSHHNNKISRVAQPVGFGWAIGNKKYGEWIEEKTADSTFVNNTPKTANNSNRRVWRSHGPSLLFWYWMLRRPTYQNQYRGYVNAKNTGKAYYGSSRNGNTTYGTRSAYQKTKRSSFFKRKSTNSLWKSFWSSKKSRSTSRYKNANSTRSRSGGFGK